MLNLVRFSQEPQSIQELSSKWGIGAERLCDLFIADDEDVYINREAREKPDGTRVYLCNGPFKLANEVEHAHYSSFFLSPASIAEYETKNPELLFRPVSEALIEIEHEALRLGIDRNRKYLLTESGMEALYSSIRQTWGNQESLGAVRAVFDVAIKHCAEAPEVANIRIAELEKELAEAKGQLAAKEEASPVATKRTDAATEARATTQLAEWKEVLTPAMIKVALLLGAEEEREYTRTELGRLLRKGGITEPSKAQIDAFRNALPDEYVNKKGGATPQK